MDQPRRMTAKISKILAKDLLYGKANYIKKGYLSFDELRISNENCVFFKNKHVATVTFSPKVDLKNGDILKMKIADGQMKLNIS